MIIAFNKNKRTIFTIMLIGVFIALLACSSFAKQESNKILKQVVNIDKYDLDGDGNKDRIKIEFSAIYEPDYFDKCVVAINGTLIVVDAGEYENYFFKVSVVIINTKDGKKQIAISHGIDNTVVTSFIGYDGKKPKLIGTIPGTLKGVKSGGFDNGADIIRIKGDSIIRTTEKSDILQSWQIKRKYVFVNDSLYLIDEDFYKAYEPSVVKVIKNLSVYTKRDSDSEIVELKKGQKITLLGTDNYIWVKIKNSKGNIYWIEMNAFLQGYSNAIQKPDKNTELDDAQEYLDGLMVYG